VYRRVVQVCLAAEVGIDHVAHSGGPVREAPELGRRLRSARALTNAAEAMTVPHGVAGSGRSD